MATQYFTSKTVFLNSLPTPRTSKKKKKKKKEEEEEEENQQQRQKRKKGGGWGGGGERRREMRDNRVWGEDRDEVTAIKGSMPSGSGGAERFGRGGRARIG